MNDRLWRREADIHQKEAEAELVGKAAILSDLKGGDGGNCLARRGPRLKNFHPGPSRELAGFDDQVRAKASSSGG
jgi:hypothetical protein